MRNTNIMPLAVGYETTEAVPQPHEVMCGAELNPTAVGTTSRQGGVFSLILKALTICVVAVAMLMPNSSLFALAPFEDATAIKANCNGCK